MSRLGSTLIRQGGSLTSCATQEGTEIRAIHAASNNRNGTKRDSLPNLADLLCSRNFKSAVSLLQKERSSGRSRPKSDLWLGYCLFHAREYKEALAVYERLMRVSGLPTEWERTDCEKYSLPSAASAETSAGTCNNELSSDEKEQLPLLKGLCHFALQQPEKGLAEIRHAKPGPMQRRLLLLLRMQWQHQDPRGTPFSKEPDSWEDIDRAIESLEEGDRDDQLCAAAAYFSRCRYQKGADLYGSLLSADPKATALKVYRALCCFRLGNVQEAERLTQEYLAQHPGSLFASNLLWCCLVTQGQKEAAQKFLQGLCEEMQLRVEDLMALSETLRPNLCFVQGASRELPAILEPLVGVLPERLRDYLVSRAHPQAFVVAASKSEKALKAGALLMLGQCGGREALLTEAQSLFQEVASSKQAPEDCPLKLQCAMYSFCLQGEHQKAWACSERLLACGNKQPALHWTRMLLAASMGIYEEALACILAIDDKTHGIEECYPCWFVRLHVKAQRPEDGFRFCMQQQGTPGFLPLLQQFAADCHVTKQYRSALEAFAVLEQVQPNHETHRGFCAAAAGLILQIACGQQTVEAIPWLLQLLNSSQGSSVTDLKAAAQRVALHFEKQQH
ncbi:tetratricopeptide repeat-containing protein 26 [Cyclospora cayetanensis]|uniref:Tetratricopeptide repeat-containing protein 26 n=1 Tax=Cyclospora cayetanensis TaxID=88456 RepID=A0A1D3CZ15_9EIME|nr:tetratricopeptide repeat-containing protein 26 [Cyclospora cayetanensis]